MTFTAPDRWLSSPNRRWFPVGLDGDTHGSLNANLDAGLKTEAARHIFGLVGDWRMEGA